MQYPGNELDSEQQGLLESLPMSIIVSESDGTIVFANSMAEQMFAYAPQELRHSAIGRLVPAHVRAKNNDQNDNRDSPRFGKPPPGAAVCQKPLKGLTAIRKDASTFFADIRLSTLNAGSGDLWVTTIADVTEQQRSQTEALRSNEDLLQFAFVAAHDLKAPLRGIRQLAGWMLEDKEDSIRAAEHFRLLTGRIKQMNGLIDDLLEHSRIGHKNDVREVALPELIRNLYALADPPGGLRFELECSVSKLRTVFTPFEEMLRNLIANAVNHHDKQEGRVRVFIKEVPPLAGVMQAGESIVSEGRNSERCALIQVEVEDDGPGIETKYHHRIFGLFETLNSVQEVKGSGIGLALVRKICERYGAQLSLLSAPGVGSRFTVLWPKRITQDPQDNCS